MSRLSLSVVWTWYCFGSGQRTRKYIVGCQKLFMR